VKRTYSSRLLTCITSLKQPSYCVPKGTTLRTLHSSYKHAGHLCMAINWACPKSDHNAQVTMYCTDSINAEYH